jgi:hypothetical protein
LTLRFDRGSSFSLPWWWGVALTLARRRCVSLSLSGRRNAAFSFARDCTAFACFKPRDDSETQYGKRWCIIDVGDAYLFLPVVAEASTPCPCLPGVEEASIPCPCLPVVEEASIPCPCLYLPVVEEASILFPCPCLPVEEASILCTNKSLVIGRGEYRPIRESIHTFAFA